MAEGNDPKTGRFQKGHKINKKDPDIVSIEKQGGKKFLQTFDKFLKMPLNQLKTYTHDLSRLSSLDAIVIKFVQEAMSKGDVQRLKLIMTRYGIPTELKAVAVQEFSNVMEARDVNGEPEQDPMELSKQEKLDLLEKYKKIVESE